MAIASAGGTTTSRALDWFRKAYPSLISVAEKPFRPVSEAHVTDSADPGVLLLRPYSQDVYLAPNTNLDAIGS
jgi:hypothetical protein